MKIYKIVTPQPLYFGTGISSVKKAAKFEIFSSIDVDSCQGQLYFTNWNAQRPSIQRSWLSGFGLESVITTKIRMPNAIVIDDQERKMYWADARLDKIELVYLDNMDRIVMKKAMPQHPFGLALHGHHLFYTG